MGEGEGRGLLILIHRHVRTRHGHLSATIISVTGVDEIGNIAPRAEFEPILGIAVIL